jgi:hypothetical protein
MLYKQEAKPIQKENKQLKKLWRQSFIKWFSQQEERNTERKKEQKQKK